MNTQAVWSNESFLEHFHGKFFFAKSKIIKGKAKGGLLECLNVSLKVVRLIYQLSY